MGFRSFFGGKGKKETREKAAASELDDAMKAKLRTELKTDSNKAFDTEWKRTTTLEREVVDKYGFQGIKVIFENRNSEHYYNLGSFPADCPWYSLNSLSLRDCIEKNFKPIGRKLPRLISSIVERCEFIYAEKENQNWYLHYFLQMSLYDGRDYYRIYTGGLPNHDVKTNASLQSFDWEVPKDLKEFYAVHDGFGEIYDAGFVLNSNDIRVMGTMMNPISKEQGVTPEGYSFDDLLDFFPDGAGNSQCFIRTDEGNNITVDWDHEVWEISEEIGFYDFIDDRMSKIDEE